MTEEEARAWVVERFSVSRETALARYAEILVAEAERQNLIAASTLPELWSRHLVDSAQLLTFDTPDGSWIDIGSGAGFPGIVVAALVERPVVLVEPRAKRVEFLRHVIEALSLDNAAVHHGRIETNRPAAPAAVISARAVAALPDLFAAAVHCANSSTAWLLPKGRNAQSEVDAARAKWQGSFHVEQSITQPDSGIVVARGVRRR